ncbi:MAG: hypothetical protein PHU36_09050 [Syntrophomonadaceae bacterium]|nr:hypothetical protein [Syntrophomonadaceae bacterium]
MQDNIFIMSRSIMDSNEWKELERRENEMGSEKVLEEIIDKRIWSNAEIIWILRRLIYFYGKKDKLLKIAPPERLLTNIADVLRTLFILYDTFDPDLDDNLRSYVCSKLTDATWGISSRTRIYLEKLADNLD